METIYIPFPKDLYDKIVIRSGGKVDPCILAVDQVEGFLDVNGLDPSFWTEEGLKAFEEEQAPNSHAYGDPSRGFQWKTLFLPNGAEVKMVYKGRTYHGVISHERVTDQDGSFTPAEWARKVANYTARNAWRDIWIRKPGQAEWILADKARKLSE
ncbi:hypothetical protein [Halomonas sp.]|uniref:hypothetical protein n=1 Tax=Halomonas sp. TaxID=1486246 RepID=UPI00298D7BEA|nr:hypothetical protein [Halomonas sp.]MDW7747019.1 hypothetical protein [Halomonas sp.]